jgi:hypothetical protein
MKTDQRLQNRRRCRREDDLGVDPATRRGHGAGATIDQLGPDDRDRPRGFDAQADLPPLESDHGDANLVADVQLFHELAR